jgi:hypothetical protein
VFFTAFTGVMLAAQKYGQGKHQWDITIADGMYSAKVCDPIPISRLKVYAMQLVNIVEILYGPGMLCSKYALLTQIKRIFSNIHRRHIMDWVLQFLIWGSIATWVAFPLTFIFACVPREAIWNATVPGRCIDSIAALIASAGINVVSDILFIALPIWGTMQLQLPKKKKLGVATLFGTGILYEWPLRIFQDRR